ncbi:hypothetical protein [Mannheimia pernigra]|uniref:Uncharacterized protein n=1 Tax=Mannheimia pernigra TaxID=111844 RepID=A0A7D5E1J1_9PAST|nr:hypothetical protein [Mannheimia pernigra]QLB39748.1 hypothetical protein HV559_02005 [Mannheimia pernigra]
MKKIYNIEALRKHLKCNSYAELESYGYDVDGYFSEQKHKKHNIPIKKESNNFTSKTEDEDYETYDDYIYNPVDFMNFTDPMGYYYMGT